MRILSILLICICSTSFGASYFVRTNGNDTTGTGATGNAWRTIAKALTSVTSNDTVTVGDGDYDESLASSTPGLLLQSENLWGAQIKHFRHQATNQTTKGFRYTRFSDANRPWGQSLNANIRVDTTAHGASSISNWFGPGVYVMNTNFTFVSGSPTNAIVCPLVDFNAAGFTTNSHIYIGSSGLDGLWPSNHNTAWMVHSISGDGHTMYVTNNTASSFISDPGTNYWAAIHAGNGSESLYAIYGAQSGGVYASNWTVVGNVFSNTFGAPIFAFVDGAVIRSNYFGPHAGYRTIALQGDNIYFENNIVKGLRSAVRYTQQEIQNLVHPGGADWFDYASSEFSAFAQNSSNIFMRWNWIQDVDNQLGLCDPFTNSYGFYVHSNVFVGVTEHWSGGRSGIEFIGNTFYRTAYEFGESTPLAIGSSPPSVLDMVVMRNLFIDCGDHSGGTNFGNTEGWYTISTNAISPVTGSNWVAGAEVLGWHAKTSFTETNGVNGGDPAFVDADDPLGPDGLPFTNDDGLRPVPGSRLALSGIGALSPPTNGAPVAHFTLTSPIGWLDDNTTNYSPSWVALKPWDRAVLGAERPWQTPDTLGAPPVFVQFTATNSYSATPIATYTWNFGDGSFPLTVDFSHTGISEGHHWFCSTGTFVVSVTLTNVLGQSSTHSNTYRVVGPVASPIKYVSTSGDNTTGTGSQVAPWRTISKANTNSSPGDFIAVLPGNYDELVDITRDANPTNRIRFIGYGARSSRFNVRKPDYTFSGFQLTTNSGSTALVYLYPEAHRTEIINNILGPATNNTYAVNFVYGISSAPGHSASDCVISNNLFYRIDYIHINMNGGTNNVWHNTAIAGEAQADFVRPAGKGHRIVQNTMTNVSNIDEAHTDLFQWFGFRSEYSMGFDTNDLPGMTFPLDGNSITINGSTRTWRNSVSTPSTEILIAPTLPGCGTNLWNQIAAFPLSNTTNEWESGYRTTVRSSISGTALVRSRVGTWGYIGTVEQPEVYLQDVWLIGNRMLKSRSQVCQIETYEQNTNMVGPVYIAFNIFNGNGAANVSGNGFKFWNNLWYLAPTNTGISLTGGGTKGSAYGTEIINCSHIKVGSNPANAAAGWYGTSPLISNGTLDADYNYVVGWNGSNWLTKAEAPPDSSQKFRSYGLDVHGVNGGDPGLVDEAGYDFRLQTNSILLNAGTNLYSRMPSWWKKDLNAQPLASSGAWFIGPLGSGTLTEGGGGGGGGSTNSSGLRLNGRTANVWRLIVNQ